MAQYTVDVRIQEEGLSYENIHRYHAKVWVAAGLTDAEQEPMVLAGIEAMREKFEELRRTNAITS